MASSRDLQPATRPEGATRFFAERPASEAAPSQFFGGDTLDEMRHRLEQEREPGRYRVFDRQPLTRGVDVELAGVLVVEASGTVRWKPLLPIV